jgi:hypothetical protein
MEEAGVKRSCQEPLMKHYSFQQWMDFSRGILSSQLQSSMQQHLDSPCQLCQQWASLWQRVFSCASKEMGYAPAEGAVRQVKAMFGYLKASQQSWPFGLAERIFDSALALVPAGLRSATAQHRQLVYRCGDWLLELRLQADSQGLFLVGQVLTANQPAEVCRAARVLLWDTSILAKISQN